MLPPSGHIAGVWARNDDTRGVHKAPANEVVRGVVDLETNVTRGEHDQLNPIAVNCVRAFPGQGIRVWGARTLSSDPEWRYLNVRRLFNFVEKSILDRHQLGRVRARRALRGGRRAHHHDVPAPGLAHGALYGRTPRRRSSSSATRRTTRGEPGRRNLTVDVGIAPVKPAEFVVFRISQFSGAGSASE